ncbi:hypothetical protein NC653_010096 [Populus alba x Populus x berolinensis]|uniref:Uncharacterized protein n=1 Tax=Populus alba x Populus x berolinensis TaxID=444605 RepID=A0AAD6W5C1_9ROSI|nr:hypothetical protein NC653_010096 [Populus alba x Populus x berolinensis]
MKKIERESRKERRLWSGVGGGLEVNINGPGSSNMRNQRQIPIDQSINKQPTNLRLDKLRPTDPRNLSQIPVDHSLGGLRPIDPRNPKQIPIDSGFEELKSSDLRNPR